MFEFPEVSQNTKNTISQLNREEKLFQLQSLDPLRYGELNPNDIYRIERALEIALEGGKWHDYATPSGGFLQNPWVDWVPLYINSPREDLYQRINQRSEWMIQNGLLEETKNVIENYGEEFFALNSLGYNFAVEIIHGKITLECLKEKFSQSHRNYAKKQITWFKKETFLKPVLWNEALSLLKKIEFQG
jgi:tRNA dimethylallyltransferase